MRIDNPENTQEVPRPHNLTLVDVKDFILKALPGQTTTISLAKREALPDNYCLTDYVIVVKSGWAALSYRHVAVGLLRAGEVFLESAWPLKAQVSGRKVSLAALTTAELLLVERTAFFAAIADRHDVLFSMYAHECSRNLELCIRTARQRTEDLENQLAYFLWDLSEPSVSGDRVVPSLNQAIVADCLGIRREAITRKRKVLVERGLMYKRGPDWVISAQVGEAASAAGYQQERLVPAVPQ